MSICWGQDTEIIVIGAGVGGLALARTLLAAGHRVRVYERAPARARAEQR